MEQAINTEQLFGKMSQRLAHAMHEFNHSNHPRQLYWNGYHHAIVELQEDVAKLIQEARWDKECDEIERRWLDGEEG